MTYTREAYTRYLIYGKWRTKWGWFTEWREVSEREYHAYNGQKKIETINLNVL